MIKEVFAASFIFAVKNPTMNNLYNIKEIISINIP
jgi:hypothetical protein